MSKPINSVVASVTQSILKRSQTSRNAYLNKIEKQAEQGKQRSHLSCGNLAHGVAACTTFQKETILDLTKVNLAIISAYNDMVSAHQPYINYPEQIKAALARIGHTAQVAGGVPAMCDGVTQGNPGMELSLYSRDLIAQSTALSLSHNTFDGTLLLSVCDKIAPGQLIGALAFGHMPGAFVPTGPMATGISNNEKVAIRQKYVAGEVDKSALLDMECQAYHSPGTCTFYGTANSNQLVLEAMGLMLPGSAFIPPTDPLRQALTNKIATHVAAISTSNVSDKALAHVVDEKSVVNGLVALLTSGGSTNHTIHLLAVARAAGWIVTWDDLDALSDVIPLLVRMYPNGAADINAFQRAGGVPTLMRTLNKRGLIWMDANPVYGTMADYLTTPYLDKNGKLAFAPAQSTENPEVIAKDDTTFSTQGGLKLLSGNLGRGVMKVSAVAQEHRYVRAPARIFNSQHDVEAAYKQGELNQDSVIVVRYNGPAANGMPELHKLMPVMGNLMKQGLQVALVTDGRLSGASGKIPAVIHMTPEASRGGLLAKLRDGDEIEVDGLTGKINVLIDIADRETDTVDFSSEYSGYGRELFGIFRQAVSSAEEGASIF
ncbi:phosphogluconate dehydratase [Vibrio sp. HA2012]|uniref:phosphogluconate dehydratase n=1 Tax=Vibrio sp. HA2012 TaxID=1971595 RepID=UPI000C2B89E1|nr:phosphogluconate dehydratase [Vibrio sp. HA2012]PJC85118.1 phosphogluconate dehydratase [Vibrio sp. HA2012]